jgi:hypothetical protein
MLWIVDVVAVVVAVKLVVAFAAAVIVVVVLTLRFFLLRLAVFTLNDLTVRTHICTPHTDTRETLIHIIIIF